MKKLGAGQDFPDTEPFSMVPQGEEANFGETQPMPLASPAAPVIPDTLGLELAPVGGGEQDLMLEARKDGRICPLPTRWLEFYRVLQDNARGAALPAPPLSGSSWASASPAAKRSAFEAQLAWATQQGCGAPAYAFLSSLGKSDWYFGD
jgi:hypothetical protein